MLFAFFIFVGLVCEAHASRIRKGHHKWAHHKPATSTMVEFKTIVNIDSISLSSQASASSFPAITSTTSCIPITSCYDGFTCGQRYGG